MIGRHEAVVASRFDMLRGRFKREVAADDPRLRAVIRRACRRWLGARRVLDLGCGKGRFSRGGSAGEGAKTRLVGCGPPAPGCSRRRPVFGLDRVRATARRLHRSPRRALTGVMAVEVFEHLAPNVARRGVRRGAAGAPARGDVGDRRQERLLLERDATPWLPSVAVKWIDERPWPLGCIPTAGRCASIGFGHAS